MADNETTPTTRTISFTITDGTTTVSGATVKIDTTTRTTGSSGGCTFSDIEDGTISVEVSKEGYTTKTENIVVNEETTTFTIAIEATSEEPSGEGTGDNNGESTGEETTTTDEFPSFRKAYEYRGGYDKFVYDTLAELKGVETKPKTPVSTDNTEGTENNSPTDGGAGENGES